MNKQAFDNQSIYLPYIYNGLMLFFMLSVSALAYAEDEQEIGVPVIPSVGKGRHVDSIFMAPDGEHFYTLYEGALTKYLINPLQKIKSNQIDFKEPLSADNFYKVFVTSDEKKLIISKNKDYKVILIDVVTGEVIRHISTDEGDGEASDGTKLRRTQRSVMVDAILNNNEFLVFLNNKILVFDADTLIEKRSLQIDWNAGVHLSKVHKVFNRIIYMSFNGVGTIDENSYKKLELYRYREARDIQSCGRLRETKFNFDLNGINNNKINKFNVCGYPVDNNEAFADKRTIQLGFGPISTAGSYLISSYKFTLENLKTNKKYKVVQYPNGEIILFDTSSERNLALTSKARDHLRMKNSAGEIVPMNNITFKKYKVQNP